MWGYGTCIVSLLYLSFVSLSVCLFVCFVCLSNHDDLILRFYFRNFSPQLHQFIHPQFVFIFHFFLGYQHNFRNPDIIWFYLGLTLFDWCLGHMEPHMELGMQLFLRVKGKGGKRLPPPPENHPKCGRLMTWKPRCKGCKWSPSDATS
jgi:hypothetical protein